MGNGAASRYARGRGARGRAPAEGRQRIAAYIRVSDESQVETYSLDAQEGEIGRWAQRRGYDVIAVYREEGVSAHSERIEKRPQLMRLLDDAGRGLFDLVVVHTLDRWARNVGVQRQALQLLGDAHAGFASVTEDIDFTTPSGRLMLTMIGGVAEFFSDQLAVHVRKGLHERARRGLINGDPAFGYRRCREEDGCPGDRCAGGLHVVQDEAAALAQAFRRYAGGNWTLTEAAAWLNRLGLRTRNKRDTGRGAGPQPFTVWSVRDIFRNPFYTGVVRWAREEIFPGQHEAIINNMLFERVKAMRLRHASRPKSFAASLQPYLLRGLLRCAACGEAFWAERGGDRPGRPRRAYYRGARRQQECACRSTMFPAETIDANVGMIIWSLTLPEEGLERAKQRVREKAPARKARGDVLEERRRRLARAYIDGALGDGAYGRELAAIDEELSATAEGAVDDQHEAVALLDNLEALWREADVSERHRVLSSLVDAVYVDRDGRVVGIAPKAAMVPVFAALATRPEAGVTLAPAVGRYWWRRGRIELPVQEKYVQDLLQA